MFDKEQDISGPGTVVGSNVKLKGALKDQNDITIHGSVDGEVASDKNVMVMETAVIKGPIAAQMITISGKVNGTISAEKKLEITPTGKVYGSISTKDLVIRSGAIFVGKSAMIGHVEKEEKDAQEEKPEIIKDADETDKAETDIKEEKKGSGFWSKNKNEDDKEKTKYELEK